MDAKLDRGPTIRAALLLGFGLTLGLWVWTGYDFLRRMQAVETDASAINLRYTRAQELLATVRPQVLIVSVNVRTALLDPDLGSRPLYRERIRAALASADETLRRYVPVLNSEHERERVDRLRKEIDAFGAAVLDVLAADRAVSGAEVRDLLERVVPRRELIIGVTDEVQALNRAAFVDQQAALANTYRVNQRRVFARLGLSLLASLGIALLATMYASRLEGRLRHQRAKEEQNARDLQRLSARLVDAQEHERRVMARELHDELGQVLTAIKVELTLAQKEPQGDVARRSLDDALAITQSALGAVRDLSHVLHPALLDDLGLVAALDVHVQAFGRRHGLNAAFLHDGIASRFSPDVEIAAYRIVQEALTNAAKHAGATKCTVLLRYASDRLKVAIEDDGCGFEPGLIERAGAAAGLGLIGLRERAAQLNGTLQVRSAPGKGTTVVAELRVPQIDTTTVDGLVNDGALDPTLGPGVLRG